MAGSDRMNPACIVLPAGATVLAGMAWRVGWINQTTVGHAVLITLLLVAGIFTLVMVIAIPVLVVSALTTMALKGFVRLWPEKQPAAAPPGGPSP